MEEKYKALQSIFFFKKKEATLCLCEILGQKTFINYSWLLAVTIIKYGRYYFDHLYATSSREKHISQKQQ